MVNDIVYETTVTSVRPKGTVYLIELRDQRFHPDGEGGQLGDRGTVGGCRVQRVISSSQAEDQAEEMVRSESASIEISELLKTGTPVICRIDGQRRKEIAQQHSAQHMMSALLAQQYQAQTVGFQMGEESSTLDIDIAQWDWDRVSQLENDCFEAILSQIPIEVFQVEAKDIHQYTLRKPIPDKIAHLPRFRLVKIGDMDTSLCSGFHTTNTSQIGLVKIIRTERIKGSWTRLTFLAGKRALSDYQHRVQLLNETTQKLSTSIDELDLRLNKLLDENISTRRLNKHLSEEFAQQMYAKVRKHGSKTGPSLVVEQLPTADIASEFASKLVEMPNLIGFLVYEMGEGYGFILISTLTQRNALAIYSELRESFGWKGGGNERMVRGKASQIDLQTIRDMLEHGD